MELYAQAGAQGYTDAQYNLGVCYHTSQGVVQDLKKAVMFYVQAAAQGQPQAQEQLERIKKELALFVTLQLLYSAIDLVKLILL